MEHDVQGWRRWIPVLLGMGLASLTMWMAQSAIISQRGATGPTVLLSERPTVAILGVGLAVVLAFGAAVAVGRLVNAVTGLFVLGWGLAILTMRTATMRELAFTPGLSMWMIIVETLLWAGIILAAVLIMLRLVGKPHDWFVDIDHKDDAQVFSIASLRGASAAILILPAMWFIAQSEAKGQVLAAAVIGSLAAGLLGRLFAPHGSPVLMFIAPILVGAVGQAIGLSVTPKPIDSAYVSDSMSPLLLLSPLDLAAGSLMGVSMGVGWAKSFLHHEAATATG